MHLACRCRSALLKRPCLRPLVHATQVNTAGLRTESNSYTTLKQRHQFELEVKRSKFLATAWPVTSGSEALNLINSNKDLSASHNCFAYKSGQDSRCSDDGEPSGTAGQPILSAISGEQLDGVCVMVTRFYGGTKLGTGGLARAYGGAARECLRSAETAVVHFHQKCHITAYYDNLGPVYNMLDKYNVRNRTEDHMNSAEVLICCEVTKDALVSLQQDMLNATGGGIDVVPVNEADLGW